MPGIATSAHPGHLLATMDKAVAQTVHQDQCRNMIVKIAENVIEERLITRRGNLLVQDALPANISTDMVRQDVSIVNQETIGQTNKDLVFHIYAIHVKKEHIRTNTE